MREACSLLFHAPLMHPLPSFTDWPMYYHVFYSFATCSTAPVLGVYLTMCITAPHLMKLFRPLDLRSPLVLHNIICTALSAYCIVCFVAAFSEDSNIFSTKSKNGVLKHGMFVYWMTKLYELLDTVFMVLRHKKKQISFLHVFHHASVPLIVDYAYNQACWPAFLLVGIMNSSIHIVMYGYYGLTAFYPVRDFPIKKRITQLQMTQFVLVAMQGLWGYLKYNFCIYSILYPIGLLTLFSNFYYNAFLRPRKRSSEDRKKEKWTVD